jgi:hypothetical protein
MDRVRRAHREPARRLRRRTGESVEARSIRCPCELVSDLAICCWFALCRCSGDLVIDLAIL